MELDTKQKVLLAIYAQWQIDETDMESITPLSLGLDVKKFNIAMQKLHAEELVRANLVYGGPDPWPILVIMGSTEMTSRGIEYVERLIEAVESDTKSVKLKKFSAKAVDWGIDKTSDFFAKVIAEVVNHQLERHGL